MILVPIRAPILGLIALAILGSAAPAAAAGGFLPLDDRLACQRAVEEVYWRHRIWPDSNPGPKPALDEVLPHDALRRRVEGTVLGTLALSRHWRHEISGADLQQEIERMFAETRRPGMLREIAAAVGDDPFLFAECVARPALTERLLASFLLQDQRFEGAPLEAWLDDQRSELGLEIVAPAHSYRWPAHGKHEAASALAGDGSRTVLDVPALASGTGRAEKWTPMASLPEGVFNTGAVWTGTEMIIWGGDRRTSGSRYNPATDTWSTTAAIGAPSPRSEPSAIWTGREMIVWGGCGQASNFCELATGGRYDPTRDSWTPVNTTGGPIGRRRHVAVWTGSRMILWGGCRTTSSGAGNNNCAAELSSGSRYDPATDTWAATSTVGAPAARVRATGVWTGSVLVVWGGYDGANPRNDGGRYNPAADTWLPTSAAGAPSARNRHSAVWTGTEMIVWGGCAGVGCFAQFPYLDTGGRYDPASNTWAAVSLSGAPSARGDHTAVWTGSAMIVWGGATAAGNTSTGGRYDPGANSWTPTAALNAPSPRAGHRAVWTGTRMIVWGADSPGKTGGRYDPIADAWTPTNTSDPGEAREDHVAVWTGAEMLVWGGRQVPSTFEIGTGDRYDPATGLWRPISEINAPFLRERGATAVWTGTRMIVWGGQTGTSVFNTGGRYDPVTDTWQTTSTAGAPRARADHAAVWTGSRMIVWGGISIVSSYEDTGGRYDPQTNTWSGITMSGAPAGRRFPSAVWTGSEAIVWGGSAAGGNTSTGGRYDPQEDRWTATSTAGAPTGRHYHTALWSGTEMLIWGGMSGSFDTPTYYNSGGRYNPAADAWSSMAMLDAPSPRVWHGSVWTGSEMLVWGGCTGFSSCPDSVYTGGRYDPSANAWSALTTQSAPSARYKPAAVWTGSEMLIWGGLDDVNGTYTTSGAGLNPYAMLPPAEISPPGAVQPLVLDDAITLRWESGSENGALTFNLYRGTITAAGFGGYGACHQSGIPTSRTTDPGSPPVGTAWSYLVSGVNAAGEGTLGAASSGAERLPPAHCP